MRAFWDKRPCNVNHSHSPIGSEQYFNEVEKKKYFVEPHIAEFADFGSWKGKKVLEIGCGIGTDTINFARAGAHVTAVDISSNSLDMAKQRAKLFNLTHQIRFIQANVEILSEVMQPEQFDLIYSFGVLHHTPSPIRAIGELKKFSGKGTILKIMVYNFYSWKVLSILLANFWRLKSPTQLIADNSEAQFGCPVTYTYTKASIRKILNKTGWAVGQVDVRHIFPYKVSFYRKHQYVYTFPIRFLPRALFNKLQELIGWHLCVTASDV